MTTTDEIDNDTWDVVVVGGGAAGLGAAMALGRSRRSVLVVDAGEPRNSPAGHAHNYLGREAVDPRRLLADGRAEVAAYGVELLDDRVTAVTGETDAFVVTTAGGREVRARRVLATGGVVDELPAVPGLAERWGTDVLHCPYCHGWEVRDRAIAVLATSPVAGHHGLLFRQLSDDVVVVVADGVELPGDDVERLAAMGVRFEPGTPRELVVEDDRLVGLRLADGSLLARDAVVVAPRVQVRADFLSPLGLAPEPVEMGGALLGSVLRVDPMTGATAVPGVFAAGNATDVSMTLMASAAHGNRVGAFVNADLAAADAARAVAQRRADFFERPAWEERYSSDKVWSGRVNPVLAAEAATLSPGRALDVGCGEGGDAIWLTQQGWQVTATDFAEAALRRTEQHAADAGVGDLVATRLVDVREWDAGDERWDLVSSQFVHLPDGGMVDVVRRLAAAVAPGGTLLVVGHHPHDLERGLRHGHHMSLHTAESLLPALEADGPDAWEVEACDARPRTQTHPQTGEEMETVDAVLRARRIR
ncbi:bifunctional NAD(P)/FAD-dependent oxidoreductase/class I SAM-dependent methyltransferase [Nocardioides solisilvae]|uniref:bifunctional NAD(P)/FAD-dependent oxidoreductase/class I SAM-dependent methyltransferase n=1 Tax=Nocardioides solisilvae TaxID=1542435 RepID=UPI000D74B8A6|nr:bifunctional NAD(P)/FAD-dependent oxidoreductase/class I SAM-dependent methyltransferase [Nocardioides solisilvae]